MTHTDSSRAIPLRDNNLLHDILTRGIAEIIPQDLFVEKIQKGERMTIYVGVDPTGPYIHLGHAVILRKLRKLQELGHDIVLLIGDFTARIGDPTGRDAARTTLSHEEILENAKTYKEQAAKILDFSETSTNPARMDFNARWLDALTFQDVIRLTSHFTVQQMVERDMFETRIEEGKPIYLHEFLYPVMQGYDSVALDVDAEIGGSDQLFNMLTGRTLLKEMKKKEKVVIACELLEGLDGRKMSKSYQNIIGVTDSAVEMFGKIMSLNDELIPRYFWLCADASAEDVAAVEEALKNGENPRDWKMRLARAIIPFYHSEQAAEEAENEFRRVFQQKERPTEIPLVTVSAKKIELIELLVEVGMASSKSDARRSIEQGGVRVNDERIGDVHAAVLVEDGMVLQVGKRKFVQLSV